MNQNSHGNQRGTFLSKHIALSAISGIIAGALFMMIMMWVFMPSMMIVTKKSPLSFEETVAAIEQGMNEQAWSSPGKIDLQKSLAKHEIDLPYRVRIIQLCKPEYARDVLKTDRYLSSMMPCAIAVYEDDEGNVMVAKMNTGLMGKIFGGNVAKIMGNKVAEDEHNILAAIHP